MYKVGIGIYKRGSSDNRDKHEKKYEQADEIGKDYWRWIRIIRGKLEWV